MTPTQPSQVEAAERVEELMTLVYAFTRAYQHDIDGSYVVKNQRGPAEAALRAELTRPHEVDDALSAARIRCGAVDPQRPCNVNCAGCEGCCGNLPAEQGDAKDAERLDWLASQLFGSRWNGVIDSGSQTHWGVAPDIRHKAHHMIGNTFRDALDAAILASKPAAGENTSTPADPYGY